jgi:hypothetical protein
MDKYRLKSGVHVFTKDERGLVRPGDVVPLSAEEVASPTFKGRLELVERASEPVAPPVARRATVATAKKR